MLSVQSWRWHVRLAGMMNFLLGALLSAWPRAVMLPPVNETLGRSFAIAGTLIALCGAGSALLPRRNMLLSTGSLVLGFCVLLSPIAFELQMTWPSVAIAALAALAVMALSWWSVSETLQVRGLLSS